MKLIKGHFKENMSEYLVGRVYNMLKELRHFSRGQETIKMSQMKILERKTMLLDMGNTFSRFINWKTEEKAVKLKEGQ